MNKLMEHKQYESVLDLFHKQLAFFSEQNSGGKVLDKRKLKNSIPYDQASIVIEALLYMVYLFILSCGLNYSNK